jgi:hypothetical protein
MATRGKTCHLGARDERDCQGSGLTREALYKALRPNAKPRYNTLPSPKPAGRWGYGWLRRQFSLDGSFADIIELLAQPGAEDIKFEPPRSLGFWCPADIGECLS